MDVIDNRVYLSDKEEFCEATKQLSLQDFLDFCKNRNSVRITQQDVFDYCKSVDVEILEPEIGVGDIPNSIGESIEIDLPCVNKIKELNAQLSESIEKEVSLKSDLVLSLEYPTSTTKDSTNQKHEYWNSVISQIQALISQFHFIDSQKPEVPEVTAVDLSEAQQQQSSLIEYVNSVSPEELNIEEVSIENLSDDIEEVEFSETVFYKTTVKRIDLLTKINNLIVILRSEKIEEIEPLSETVNELKSIYELFITFDSKIKSATELCDGPTVDVGEPQELLSEVPIGSKFDITSQDVTIQDAKYWRRFASLLTKTSLITPVFWSTGFIAPTGPIPFPSIYINMGVISISVPLPENLGSGSLPFLIVPFLNITGTILSPYVLFINLSEVQIGPVAPMSSICLLSWRSANVDINSVESKILKPMTIKVGKYDLDLNSSLTMLLSLILREDYPPYSRLKMTNVPFIVFSLLKIIMTQKSTVGLP